MNMHVFPFDFYRSVGDLPLPEERIGKHETTYEIIPAGSQKGNPKLVDSLGFSYTVKYGYMETHGDAASGTAQHVSLR